MIIGTSSIVSAITPGVFGIIVFLLVAWCIVLCAHYLGQIRNILREMNKVVSDTNKILRDIRDGNAG